MLGPLQTSANGADVPLGAAKQRAVLATLLINRNRIVPIDSLIDAAWQERPPPEVRGSLHAHISRLRRLVSTPAWTRRHSGQRPAGVSAQRARRGLRPRPFRHQQKAGIGAAAGGRFEQASAHLSDALSNGAGR